MTNNSVCLLLYLRNHTSYDFDFWYTYDHIIEILIMISTGVFLDFFQENETLQILELFCFLLTHFNSFLNNYLFIKFINKYQKEILRCAPHVCDFCFNGKHKILQQNLKVACLFFLCTFCFILILLFVEIGLENIPFKKFY